jgi:MTH538 TIR-like domain (DUF1863)
MRKTYNLFISHSWAYSDAYDKFIKLLERDSSFSYRNYSVPKHDPILNARNDRELYEAIKKQVSYCHCVIIMAGVYSTYSKWINKEIEIANKGFLFKKPIIAVEPWASTKTSTIVKSNADEIVKWNSKSLISAIKRLS